MWDRLLLVATGKQQQPSSPELNEGKPRSIDPLQIMKVH